VLSPVALMSKERDETERIDLDEIIDEIDSIKAWKVLL